MRTSNHKTKTRLVALALVLVEIFSLMTNVVYGLPDTAATDTSLAEETSAYEETAAPTVDEAAPEASDPAQSEEAPAAAEGPSDPAGPETVTTATHLEEAATATDLEEAEETATATDLEVRTVSADLTAYDGTRYTVHVSYGADAGLPDGAELAVRQVLLAPEGHEAHRAERLGRPYKTERFLEAEEFAACDEALRQALEVQEEDYLPLYVLLDVKLVSGTDLLEPAAPVTVTVETDGAVSGQERAMAAALLWVDEEEDEDGQTVEVTRAAALEKADEAFADETFAEDDGDEEKPRDTATVSFATDTLGTMGILCVAEKKETWQVRGVTLTLYGPKDLQYTAEPVYSEPTAGVTVLAAFRTPEIGEDGEIAETDGAATMWLSAVAGDSAPWAWSENDGLRGWYTDRDGERHALFGANGTAQPVAITAGDAVEVLWDSGLRQAELTEGAVTVSGLLPPEAELTAKDVTADYDDAASLTGTDSEYTRTVAAYDIDVTADGRTRLSGEADPVEVTVENRAIAPGKAITVWFVDEDGTASRVDCVLSSRKLTFSASRRGVYVVVNSGETTRVATDGRTYEITVTYGPEAAIPAQAALSVRELTGPEYAAYYYRTQVQTGVNSFDTMRAYDIVFVLPDGTEVEPQAPVNVSIRTLDRVIENAQVVHFADGGTEVIDPDVLEDGETLDFTAGSFSVYVVCAWTVEFHWGDYAYHINGNSSILLSELLKKLDVDITLADVTDVSFSNDKYIAIERQVSDWLLRALAPFDTEEALILTLKNGQTVEIRVTDDPEPPKALTIAAASRKVTFDGNELTMAGTYTCEGGDLTADICSSTDLAEGHHIESVTLTGSQTLPGSSPNVPSGAVIWDGEGNDVTEQYDITYVNGALTVDWPADVITVTASDLRGDIMTYTVTVNPNADIVNEGKSLIVSASFGTVDEDGNYSESVDYSSVHVSSYPDCSYDYSGNTGTFYIPDGEPVTITYETRVKGSAGQHVYFTSSATVARSTDSGAEAQSQPVTASGDGVISPTGSDIAGTGGVYGIKLLVYPQNHMERGLKGATFRLLDSNMRPIKYKSGVHAGEVITFTTGDDGYADVVLSEETDGLCLHKNTVYFLEMTEAPYEDDPEYVYYKKDNTFYSFLISDEASYQYGSVYTYFNGDVLKVRCYPESGGVNVTLRFSGNYTLDPNDARNIRFILQKEALDTESGWLDVESHTYAEFSYGSINFEAGSAGGPELEDNATYRVIEENALPATASDLGIDEDVSVSISYQVDGMPREEDSNEFFVDPMDKKAFSYNLAFTNEYIDHKLTVYKIDEANGHVLSGAQFTVYTALEDTPVKTYTTGDDGTFIIRAGDELDGGAHYAQNKLYYARESDPPANYVMPQNPEKYYFYISGGGSTAVPTGLPANTEVVDLTTSYSSITIPNDSNAVDVPVTVVWGVNGEDPWPGEVKSVMVGLYRSVGGAAAEPVPGKELIELTDEVYYNAYSFTGLPARINDAPVTYSVKAVTIYGEGNTDITDHFASSSSISGTGWYVIYNQGAISVTVNKEWYAQNGTKLSPAETAGKPAVTFALYRSTVERASFDDHDAITAFLGGLEPVRTGLQLTYENGWTATVDSLEEKDKEGNTYYYYALENVPTNQEDSYTVSAADGDTPRTLTIKNQQTPPTVTIQVSNIEVEYGEDLPAYVFTANVDSDQVGSTVTVTGPNGSGEYTATVTEGGVSKSIRFTATLPAFYTPHRNVGTYAITLALAEGADDQGYRVLFGNGTLKINPAEVTITAGASKTYGEPDPALVTLTDLKFNDDPAIVYTVSREEGEDAGDYDIELEGEEVQGNYTVNYVTHDGEGMPYVFTIHRADATVTADNLSKFYGEDDPVLTASVTGLTNEDEPSVIIFDLIREAGEDKGTYVITSDGEAAQGNYNVTFLPGTFTINPANVTVTVEDAEKTYGDEDPDWDVTIDGLAGDDDESAISYTVTREAGEDVKTTGDGAYDTYAIVASGTDIQGNYAVTYKDGALTITRAELVVTPRHIVRALNVEDPLLTAEIDGWRNGDDAAEPGQSEVTAAGTVWTYKIGEKTLLTFTLKREEGEDEGEYQINTVAGEAVQGNYDVYYEEGTFSILTVMKVDVSQPLVDYADAEANPSFSYTATLKLTGTGLSDYEKEGFQNNAEGDPTLSFSLPGDGVAGVKSLSVPAGAKLTIVQTDTNPDYTTNMSLDGDPVDPAAPPATPTTLVINHVDTYHEVAFTHSRISLPVVAKAALAQGTEVGAEKLESGKGAVAIPRDGSGDPTSRMIDAGFVDEMHTKMGYTLPSGKYYVYDHTSLYRTSDDTVLQENIEELRYYNDQWQYRKKGEVTFSDVPANSEIQLFYVPKFVCRIGSEKFYTLQDAVNYALGLGSTDPVTIEMLIEEYTVRYASDAATIPADCSIILTTAPKEEGGYDGPDGTVATISRSALYAGSSLLINKGTLRLENITVSGSNRINATAALVSNDVGGTLTVAESATLKDAKGNNGGAIYVTGGSVTISGKLLNNQANRGGGVYAYDGSVTFDAQSYATGNTAQNGGVVYAATGTVTVDITSGGADHFTNNTAQYGGVVYTAAGAVTLSSSGEGSGFIGNTAQYGGGVVSLQGEGEEGSVAITGTVSGNTAPRGGAVYVTNGALNVGGTVTNNTADNGGAVYITGGTVTISGTLSENKANTPTAGRGGAIYQSGGTVTLSGSAQVQDNQAAEEGGAFYLAGGTVEVSGSGSQISGNTAKNGGAIYGAGGTIDVSAGTITGNVAAGSGGAIRADSAAITVSGGSITGNTATAGSGGAIYTDSGTVIVSGGTITGNSAASGNGGAIYVSRGTVTYSEGTLSGNSAVNGAAIFADTGIANISGTITGNTSSNGGAVGVGSTSARLNFSGDAQVTDNTMGGSQSNVYLDVDSELVIFVRGALTNGNKVGVYVPDGVGQELVRKRGDVGGYFGGYSSSSNVEAVFKNDRYSELRAKIENNRIYWGAKLTYDVIYKADYLPTDALANQSYDVETGSGFLKVALSKTCYPHGGTDNKYDIYDLVSGLKLYDTYKTDFNARAGNATAGAAAVYAYAFANSKSNKFDGNAAFNQFLTSVEWDYTNRKWQFMTQSGAPAATSSRIVILYSKPTYISVTNNNDQDLTLDFSDLTVGGISVSDLHYGYATAKNGATVATLRPITPTDLILAEGESVKLLFPGAAGKSYVFSGAFTAGPVATATDVSYTVNSVPKPDVDPKTQEVTAEGTLPTDYSASEIVVGDPLPICRVKWDGGQKECATLADAVTYMNSVNTANSTTEFTIEMLVDYLIPKDDVLEIPQGYQVTFTTASVIDGFKGANQGDATHAPRAKLSRDFGNTGASVLMRDQRKELATTTSLLAVKNIDFDGRAIAGSGNGGAIRTTCTAVTIQYCDFNGYHATRGGAVFTVRGTLTVENCNFTDCQTAPESGAQKAGGGGLWTTAKHLTVRNCVFQNCAVTSSANAQAGAIFHNIVRNKSLNFIEDFGAGVKDTYALNYPVGTTSLIEDCQFYDCYALGGSGGTLETDALEVTIRRCTFVNGYTNKSGGGGGAVNIWAGDLDEKDQNSTDGDVTLESCTFTNCKAQNSGFGGALRTTAAALTLRNCTFEDALASQGGAVAMTNKNAATLNIFGCTFKTCESTGTTGGGAVSATAKNVTVGDYNTRHTLFEDCTANTDGGGIYLSRDITGSTADLTNVTFRNCTASTANSGGGLFTKAETVTVTGDATLFTNCTAQNLGGGIYQGNTTDGSSFTFTDGVMDQCTALGDSGGAIYAGAKTVTMANGTVTNSTAKYSGAGIWMSTKNAATSTITNCTMTDLAVTRSDGCGAAVYIGGGVVTVSDSHISGAAGNGGAVYQAAGTLTVTDSTVSGTVSGMADGNGGAIYHRGTVTVSGGTITGTASANGGAIYSGFVNANSTLTVNGGATIGGVDTDDSGNLVYHATAVNGGAVYVASKVKLTLNGGTIAGRATTNGGGVFVGSDGNTSVHITGGTVAGTAASGGGIYQSGGTTTVDAGGTIGGTIAVDGSTLYLASAASGGGVYLNSGTLTVGGTVTGEAITGSGGGVYVNSGTLKLSGGTVADSKAAGSGGGVYYGGGTFNMTAGNIRNNTATENGGGVYQASGSTFTMSGGTISGNTAINGGGVYHGAGTFTMSTADGASAISGNTATSHGGGVYTAAGTFNMNGGTIGGEDSGNTADKGGGLFVANGRTPVIKGAITYNQASAEGGGITVGGENTILMFGGSANVQYNIIGISTECNVYLDQDKNTVVQSTGLNADAYVGVYVSDSQQEAHGGSNMPFGTYSNTNNLNRFINDRWNTLYGVQGDTTKKEIKWASFVCKITDADGNLLYKDNKGAAAVYDSLEAAFTTLNVEGTPTLYKLVGDTYRAYPKADAGETTTYQIQMLVREYELKNPITLNKSGKTITLTTASATPDALGFKYDDVNHPYATVTRVNKTNGTAYGSMFSISESNLTFERITIDGGYDPDHGRNYEAATGTSGAIVYLNKSTSTVTIGANATLCNSKTTSAEPNNANKYDSAGGAVRVQSGILTLTEGARIENCYAKNGGGISLKAGTVNMTGGTITGCSATHLGGGVAADANFNLSGGTITGNNAGVAGGGISLGNKTARVTFSGNPVVMGNTLSNGTKCNLELRRDSVEEVNGQLPNGLIKSAGLGGKAQIGIYTVDAGSGKAFYSTFGQETQKFAIWETDSSNLYSFINDRDTTLRGYKAKSGNGVIWEFHPLLTVTNTVDSDLASDANVSFQFKVTLTAPDGNVFNKAKLSDVTGMTFTYSNLHNNATATLNLKAGESATAVFPEELQNYLFEVAELGTTGEDIDDFITTAEKAGEHSGYYTAATRTVTGALCENMEAGSAIACLAEADYTNTRQTGTLVVSNTVTSGEAGDFGTSFTYNVALSDTTINKTYLATKTDLNGAETSVSLEFTGGEATFDLLHGESLTIPSLPKDAGYTVTEVLESTSIRTFVYKDGNVDGDQLRVKGGTIGETTETVGGQPAYVSRIDFWNDFLEIMCKITDRNRNLLCYREANGALTPAVYSRLEDAFDQINNALNKIRTSNNGSVSGALRIEMVVPSYELESALVLNSGRTVILSTAKIDDTDEFPYNDGVSDGNGNVATVYRGNCDTTMITDSGVLTLDHIILDGREKDSVEAVDVACDGGIVRVEAAVKLTVNDGATLRKAKVTGNGGAICMNAEGASLTMNGTIENCTAANGGGVYTVYGFDKFQIGGTIADCTATANGGAVYAAAKGGSSAVAKNVNIVAGVTLTGNHAGGNGGAIWSAAPVIVRGTIGGTGAGKGNSATGSGGGVYMDSDAIFTMYTGGAIDGNTAANGGGLATVYTTRISGGSFTGNTATANGGAIYATGSAEVTISGKSALQGNRAANGGAVYDDYDVNMTGGTFTGNRATGSGSAFYVTAGHRLDMTGGTIGSTDGAEGTANCSDGGAVYGENGSVLNFSGNTVIQNNTNWSENAARNVYLGHDSNEIIQTSGLGNKADIGVYVADGAGSEVYYNHGVSARKFGIYIGSNVGGANLKKFTSDRIDALAATAGPAREAAELGNYYVMWTGRGLQLQVSRVKEGEADTAVSGVKFELYATITDLSVKIWSGTSDAEGIVTIPWGSEDKANGTSVSFMKESYILRQTAASGDTVCPSGYWVLTVGKDNSVTWTAIPSGEDDVDQIHGIALPASGKAYLGETFGLSNDAKPRVIYHATYGKWSNNDVTRERTVNFNTTETSHEYQLAETIPAWSKNVFTGWATAAEPGAGDYIYQQDDTILFYRDNTAAAEKYKSGGDLNLYAQWDYVVCKITDRDEKLLYINGTPAVYGSLEDAFMTINNSNNSTFTYKNGGRASARRIEMLVERYELTANDGLELASGKTILLTTASKTGSDEYTYSGTASRCTIYRGACDTSMITVDSNLTLQNIILDGRRNKDADPEAIVCDGGILYVKQAAAVASVGTRAELHNSLTDGDGGAIYVADNTRLYLRGGTVSGNSVTDGHNGAGVYLNPTSKLYISDDPNFGGSGIESDGSISTTKGNFVLTDVNDLENGGVAYTRLRQDIYIAGHGSDNEDDTSANSLVIAGNITSGAGTIWVWAEESPRYKTLKQFAVVDRGVTVTEETCSAFRNARDDETTGNNTGEYLHGTLEGEVKGCVYWSGFSGSGTVILRKVNSANEPVYGATFTVYRGTSTDPYEVDGTPLSGLTSGEQGNGVFYAGELPYGIYWIEETAVPSGYSTTRRYFKLTVTKDGNEISAASTNRNG